jgi:signal transduction histidine kinase
MSIVDGLVRQLRGVLRIDRGAPGACFVVTIPQRAPT